MKNVENHQNQSNDIVNLCDQWKKLGRGGVVLPGCDKRWSLGLREEHLNTRSWKMCEN
jgi:hypothetical protein